MAYKIWENGKLRDATAEEETSIKATKASSDSLKDKKLIKIKRIRLQKLEATDYMANSDVTMPSYIKTWRQTLRDLPQNNTSESQYDALLERNADGSLKNSVWTQPTE